MTDATYHLPFQLQQDVIITAIEQRATIINITIGGANSPVPAHSLYECVWYANGVRQTAWLHSFEIEEFRNLPPSTRPGF